MPFLVTQTVSRSLVYRLHQSHVFEKQLGRELYYRVSFRSIFGQTWPTSPSRTTEPVLQCRLQQVPGRQTNSKAMSWHQKNLRPDCFQVPSYAGRASGLCRVVASAPV